MSKLSIKCPRCLVVGSVLNFNSEKILECSSCKYVITKDELLEVADSRSLTTCPPNCNGECSEVLGDD